MKVPRFDVFSGTDNNAQWIEVVEQLDTAFRRMEFYAAKCPRMKKPPPHHEKLKKEPGHEKEQNHLQTNA